MLRSPRNLTTNHTKSTNFLSEIPALFVRLVWFVVKFFLNFLNFFDFFDFFDLAVDFFCLTLKPEVRVVGEVGG
jgi:phosphatidylserine decarboxylase